MANLWNVQVPNSDADIVYPSADEVFPPDAVQLLVKDHHIPREKVERFRYYLKFARDFYYSDHLQRSQRAKTTADKPAVRRLKKYLKDALIELKQPEMWARLDIANAVAYPAKDGEGFDTKRHWWLMAQEMGRLLPIIDEAEKVDGRKLKGIRQSRSDIKAAATPLMYFWAAELDRERSLYNRGGRTTKALQFLLECLYYLDDTVTDSALRDLDNWTHAS